MFFSLQHDHHPGTEPCLRPLYVYFTFTDNSAIGEPDEINGIPVTAGNISVEYD